MIIENVWIYDALLDLGYETLCKIEKAKKDNSKIMLDFYTKKYSTIIRLLSLIVMENTDYLIKEQENESN